MADDRSVDMGESRDPQPPTGSRQPLASAHAKLPPAQQAYSAYAGHATTCTDCRDVDRSCSLGEELYRAWRRQAEGAFEQLGGA